MTVVLRSGRRGGPYRVLWLLAFAVLLTVRFWCGLNYSSVYVQSVSPRAESADLRIYAWMPQRSFLRELHRIPEVPQVWMLNTQVQACDSVLVVCPAGGDAEVGTLRVVCGESWTGPVKVVSLSGAAVRCQDQALVKSLVPDERSVVYELPVRRSKSLIPGIHGFNWQGDFWLLLVPLLQALLFCRVLSCLRAVVSSGNSVGNAEFTTNESSLMRVCVGILRLLLLLLVLHQIVSVIGRFVAVRSGLEAAVGSLCGLALIQGVFVCIRTIGQSGSKSGLRALLCVMTLIGIARVVWISNVDSYQSTDYARYLEVGEQVYDGRWDLLAARDEILTPFYIRRALLVTLPAIWLFGKGLAGLECWNLCLQLLTLLAFRRLVRLMTGSPVIATPAVVLLTLMPEFWYSITIATHNVMANLLICCVMLVLETIRIRIGDEGSSGWWRVFGDLGLAIVAGCCGAMLELSRSFGLFLLAAVWGISLYLLVLRVLSAGDHHTARRLVPRVSGILLTGTFVYAGIVSIVDREIASRVPHRPPPVSEALVAVDTQGTGLGRELEAFRMLYLPAVSPSEKSELTVRKLLYEKVASGVQIWPFLMRRNDVYSRQSDALVQVFDRLQGLIRPLKHTRVRWFSAQQAICDAYYLLILLLLLVRLLLPQRYPVLKSEVLPLVFIGLLAVALYVLTEAHPYYAQSFLLPLCWTAAMVADCCVNGMNAGGDALAISGGNVRREFFAGLLSLRLPALILCFVVVVHGVGGEWLNRSGLLFARISLSPSLNATDALLTQQSRVHVAVALPPAAAGTSIVREATVSLDGPRDADGSLKFFLTGSQRLDTALRKSPNQSHIRYQLMINGRIFRQGELEDLNRPEFCVVPRSEWGIPPGRTLELQIRLGGQAAARGSLPEWLAIEYPYFSGEAAK